MKKVKLTNVTLDEVLVLQNELEAFTEWHKMGFQFWSSEDFFNAIAMVDCATRLYFFLRTRVESDKQKFTMSFFLSDAVVLLKCCHWQRSERGVYETNVALKYQNIIDQQLKSTVKS